MSGKCRMHDDYDCEVCEMNLGANNFPTDRGNDAERRMKKRKDKSRSVAQIRKERKKPEEEL